MPRRRREQPKKRIERMVDGYQEHVSRHIDKEYSRQTSVPDVIADKIAEFGGSWRFIIIFACLLIGWILWNALTGHSLRFDPFPFILLNLFLSFTAAFQAPIIMMSQNRQAARDKEEFLVDHAIDFKAEQEIDDLQTRIHRMEEVIETVVNIQKEYKDQLEKMQTHNEKSTQGLIETIGDLKRSVEQRG